MLLSKKNGSGLGNFQKQTCTAKTAEKEIVQGPRAVGKKMPIHQVLLRVEKYFLLKSNAPENRHLSKT